MESGIGISNPLFFIGVVENNDDKHREGRVQVRAFSIHGTQDEIKTKDLPWAICVSGNYDANNTPPPLNSFVYGMFLDGRDAQHPMVLGLIPSNFALDENGEPTINPAKYGWGVIPEKDGDIAAKGSGPKDVGKPQNSPLARGENLEETYILSQEMTRVENAKVAGTDETWSEVGSAYAAEYPYNKVIETSKHSIEIDDTPGAERIMIRHNEGSFIQMDSSGTVNYKTMGDRHDITLNNEHVYVNDRSVVHINGDSHVYVHGNKTEEVNGDYRLLCHGNVELGSGGQLSINAAEQFQARAADVKIQANVGTTTLMSEKDLMIDAKENILMTTDFYNCTANYIKTWSWVDTNISSLYDINLFSSNIFQTAYGTLPSLSVTGLNTGFHVFSGTTAHISSAVSTNINSTGAVNVLAPYVSMDYVLNLGSGTTVPAPASIAFPNIPNPFTPEKPKMPEPPSKSTSFAGFKKSGTISSSGVTTSDDKIGK